MFRVFSPGEDGEVGALQTWRNQVPTNTRSIVPGECKSISPLSGCEKPGRHWKILIIDKHAGFWILLKFGFGHEEPLNHDLLPVFTLEFPPLDCKTNSKNQNLW